MLIVMDSHATPEQVRAVMERIKEMGLTPNPIPGAQRTAIGITGNTGPVPSDQLVVMPGVKQVIHVTAPYKQVSREFKPDDTIVDIDGVKVGGNKLAVMAGPCAVESYDQAIRVAEVVWKAGACIFRGGAFKPRTSPYSFQGLGEKGLWVLARVREETGLKIVTEAIDPDNLDLVRQYTDIIQIGARNMQNFSLLKKAGRSGKPVLLKRGMSATLEEYLMAAEYIVNEGNNDVILCERGVRTFADHTRNTLDLSAIPFVKRASHLPIIADPSHGTGVRDKVIPMARAAIAAGADGLMIEVHHEPEKALSDGFQSLYPEQFEKLMKETSAIAAVLERAL
jgi:3-deoxy-7-phosphoheptulonate synthase